MAGMISSASNIVLSMMIFHILIKWQTPLDKRLPIAQLLPGRIVAAPAARFTTGCAWAVF
jgi:hypothetical protein